MKALLVCLGIVISASGQAEESVNSVAVCYSDGTYHHVRWTALDDLADDTRRVVEINVLHVHPPISTPYITEIGAQDLYALRRGPFGMLVRRAELPPPGAEVVRGRQFKDNGDEDAEQNLGIPGASIGGGMTVTLIGYSYSASDFDTLQARCVAKRSTFLAETVPAEGTY